MSAKEHSRKTFSSNPSICNCVNLRRASRAITRIYDKAMEPAQLKITQYSVLANVAHSGPLNISKLARILKLDRTTLVRNLKSLEAAGFIENTDVSDPRERAIRITESGRLVVDQARPYWLSAQRQMEERLGAEGLLQLSALVTTLEGFYDAAGTSQYPDSSGRCAADI
jgi:DNA-binding MarR family transcriptional regulator